jgi:hypothetical protein
MAEADVIANQKLILKNQGAVLANQKRIEANQGKIQKNQEKILANQGSWTRCWRTRSRSRAARRSASQKKILAK